MMHYYWNDWYAGWGWFLWYGLLIVMFMSLGNWGYTYQAHKKYNDKPKKEALDYLNERYAKGEVSRSEFHLMKSEIGIVVKSGSNQKNLKTLPV